MPICTPDSCCAFPTLNRRRDYLTLQCVCAAPKEFHLAVFSSTRPPLVHHSITNRQICQPWLTVRTTPPPRGPSDAPTVQNPSIAASRCIRTTTRVTFIPPTRSPTNKVRALEAARSVTFALSDSFVGRDKVKQHIYIAHRQHTPVVQDQHPPAIESQGTTSVPATLCLEFLKGALQKILLPTISIFAEIESLRTLLDHGAWENDHHKAFKQLNVIDIWVRNLFNSEHRVVELLWELRVALNNQGWDGDDDDEDTDDDTNENSDHDSDEDTDVDNDESE
ncbi:hypothetical protein F5Y18DRAFT_434460 [Xylariaceae sp. FL1019]|nr:hypothetical protein F5Y18DRAFT_434460 [Xylariaceae sp. FL1019]